MMNMVINLLKRKGDSDFAESYGYYERVPIRVGEYALIKNEEGEVVFETTAREHCDDGPKIVVTICEENRWSVNARQGPYMWAVTPSIDLSDNRLARRRAFWHAAQYMVDRKLNYKETFSTRRQIEDDCDLFKDDAFFENGDAVTNDPFDEFLED